MADLCSREMGISEQKKKKKDKGHKGQIHAQINRGVEQKHLAAGRCKTNSLK